MDNCDLMAEVDAQISKILKNKFASPEKENQFCNAKNLQTCLEQLSQEFDYLDVNAIKSIDLDNKKGIKSVLIQLANSSFNLLQLYKETQKIHRNNCDKNTSTQSEIIYLRKTNEALRKDLKIKEGQIKLQNERKELEKIQTDEIKAKLLGAKKEISQLKIHNQSSVNRHKCEVQRALSEGQKTEERFRKKCGIFQNSESHVLGVLDEYAGNEKKYLKTIETLQKNNHQLLEEIVALKGDISENKSTE